MKPTNFAIRLTAFLSHFLPAQRNVSPNTIKSYRDTFTLLLRYVRDKRGIPPEKLRIEQIDPPMILAFLEHLEKERNCKIRTRNHRLAAMRAFFRYIQTEEPDLLLQCQKVMAIPSRRHERSAVGYLTTEELTAILLQPDLTQSEGRRDAVLLSLLYDTGARCQELIDISVRDVRLESPAQIRLNGKGRKIRIVPLMASTVKLLTGYIHEFCLANAELTNVPLFKNRKGDRFSRSGIRYILSKYADKARTNIPSLRKKVSPHCFRHTKAMNLLQTGNPLSVIRDILGHADIQSTEVYARADINMKRRALEKAADISPPTPVPSWHSNKDLMDWLRNL